MLKIHRIFKTPCLGKARFLTVYAPFLHTDYINIKANETALKTLVCEMKKGKCTQMIYKDM